MISLTSYCGYSQIIGCTDSLASNYNVNATINDGSCIYNSSSVSPSTSVSLTDTLDETSGLIYWDHLLWSHNDDQDTVLYAIDTLNGNVVQTSILSNVTNNDWEEISQDSLYVYIGDFGNNSNGNRTDLNILRINKQSIINNTPQIDTIFFSYSDQTNFTPTGSNNTDFDCEAFIVAQDSIYLFTKQWISKKTSIYSLSKLPGMHTAFLKNTLDVNGLITGAVTLKSKQVTVLCGYSNLLSPFLYLLYDYPSEQFINGNKRKVNLSLPFHQVESVTSDNGIKYYLTNERFTQPPIINTPQKLHTIYLNDLLGHYLNSLTTNIPNIEAELEINIFPNPANREIHIAIAGNRSKVSYQIINTLGMTVNKGQLYEAQNSIDLNELPNGIYIIRINSSFNRIFSIVR